MNGVDPRSSGQGAAVTRRGPVLSARILRLALKELRETLRDRRTIATLLLMPLLVYPLLSLAFQRFLISNLQAVSGQKRHVLGFRSEVEANQFARYLRAGAAVLKAREGPSAVPASGGARTPAGGAAQGAGSPPPQANTQPGWPPTAYELVDNLEQSVADETVDVAVQIRKTEPLPQGGTVEQAIDCELYFDPRLPLSREAFHWVERCLQAVNEQSLAYQLQMRGVRARTVPVGARYHAVDAVAEAGRRPGAPSLETLIPLILILMTITGAVYPAIDLTAGERERGTLEILVAAPVPRIQLLLAKYLAVLTVALLTAVVNLLAMFATVASMGLVRILFGDAGISLDLLAGIAALLVLFSAFFSAVLLAVTSFARSFKEAQAYLIPLMLVSIAPGMLSMIPGLKLSGPLAVTPLVNIVLLSRDMLNHSADPTTAFWVVISTGLFAAAAIGTAARIFGADAILYGAHGTWSDLFRRPTRVSESPSTGSAFICLAILFPAYFLASNLLAQATTLTLEWRLLLAALVTILVFGQIPLAVAVLNRVDLAGGFRLRSARPLVFLGAFVLGISLWAFAHEAVVILARWDLVAIDSEVLERARGLIQQMWHVSPALLVATMAVVPGICEEFFFRGFLLSGLARSISPAKAVGVSSVLFGLFHLIAIDQLHFERLVPSTFLGFVLGWVCVRSGSVLPGMLLHATQNGVLLLAARYQKELSGWGWGLKESADMETAGLPASWLVGASIAAAVGLALVQWSTRRKFAD